MTGCLICLSPIKREIDNLISADISLELIADKYYRILKVRRGPFLEVLKEHKKKKHNKVGEIVVTSEPIKVHTYDSAAEKLLQDGMNDPMLDMMGPEKKLKLAGSLKKIDIETKKLQLGADALMLQAAKFLGGFLDKPKEGNLTAEEEVPAIK
jgi:hypothetical protein